jgi:uncharacterized membrane protein YkoI
MKAFLSLGLVLGSIAAIPLARANERATTEGKSLLEIISIVERDEYRPIVEVSLDDGVWEVEAYKGDGAFELTLDPKSGKVISTHRDDGGAKPPADAMKLSEVIRALEKSGYANIDEVSFERKNWEVEATRDNQKRELRVNAKDGKVISDRVDD